MAWLDSVLVALDEWSPYSGACLNRFDCISNRLNLWLRNFNTDLTLKNCLSGSAKLTKNADPHKYKYSGFNIGFDSHSEFPFIDGSMEKNF